MPACSSPSARSTLSVGQQSELFNLFLQLLHFAVLLERLVEQHRVYLRHRNKEPTFPFATTSHQIRTYPFYVLCNEAKAERKASVQSPLYIRKLAGVESVDDFAGLVPSA